MLCTPTACLHLHGTDFEYYSMSVSTDTRGSNASTSFTDSNRGLKERRKTSGEREREKWGGGGAF